MSTKNKVPRSWGRKPPVLPSRKNKSALPVSQWCVSCGKEGGQHILEKRVATRRKAAKPPRKKFFRNQTIKKS